MQNSKPQLHSPMPLAEKWPFFFHIAFNSDCLRLKSMVHYVRGLFLISTSALATCTAFPAFQELIDCCAWQVPRVVHGFGQTRRFCHVGPMGTGPVSDLPTHANTVPMMGYL